MLELSMPWRWAAALILVGSGGCGGKSARDDLVPSASGATSSGPDPSPASATGGAAGCGNLIDDLESGSGHICAGAGRVGVWYAFNDQSGEQWPAPTTPGVPIPSSEIPGGRAGSTRAIHSYGQGFNKWGAGVGLDFAFDGARYGSYDASAFDGVRFWARSDAPQKLLVRIGTRLSTIASYGGTCPREPCGPHGLTFDVGANWVELRLPFNDLLQTGNRSQVVDFLRDELTNLQFMSLAQEFDFWIDDVQFYRDRNCCTHPPAGCEGVIEFADAALEERVRRSLGKRQGDLRCEDVCGVSPLVPSGLTEPGKINDLSGLQCLVGLTRLDLRSNQFDDIGPLANLAQVTWLGLDDNQIHDVRPLSGLHVLDSLSLRKNRLESLAGLDDLPSLRELFVDDNPLADVSPAAKLTTLSSFSANRNLLVEVRALAALPLLGMLSVEWNQIQDLGQFLEFSSLQYLGLAGNPESCTPEGTSVVSALIARGVAVSYGPVSNSCTLP